MLSRAHRLTSTQFDRAFAQSQTVRHPLIVLRAHFRGNEKEMRLETVRAAFVVPKKQGKAAFRNRTRRRLRERYRLHPNRQFWTARGCDLIFLTTPQTHKASNDELDAALNEVFAQLGRKMKRVLPSHQPLSEEKPQNEPVLAENSAQFREDANIIPQEKRMEMKKPGFSVQKPGFLAAPFTWLALALIGFYQRFISPGLPPSCRFEPTCSRYTYASIERFGVWRGGFLGACRICKCHPWHAGGLDPVPPSFPHFRSKVQIRNPFSRRRNLWNETEK